MSLKKSHIYELAVTFFAQLSFQFFSLLLIRYLSTDLDDKSFGFIGLWMVFNTSISTIVSSPISAIALRFSGTIVASDSLEYKDLSACFYPSYLSKLLVVFLRRYLWLLKFTPLIVAIVFFSGGSYEKYGALFLSIFYCIPFGFLIVLLGFFQSQRRRLEQLFYTTIDGIIKLVTILFVLKLGLVSPILIMISLTFAAILACFLINVLLPFVSYDFHGKNFASSLLNNALFSADNYCFELNPREAEQVKSATKYGFLCGIQTFLEVYVVGLFYGLQTSAALVLLTKFAFTLSVFLASSLLAHISPILFSRAETAYQQGVIPSSLIIYKRIAPILVLLVSFSAGIVSIYVSPYLLNRFFDSGYTYLAQFVPYFVFSDFLSGLSFASLPIINTFRGSSGIYRSRSLISIISLVANLSLVPFFGIWGSTFSFLISATMAYLLLSVRYTFVNLSLV